MNNIFDEAVRFLSEAQRILIVMHVSPDGDTCGSALALRQALLAAGKSPFVVCEALPPQNCSFLTGWDSVMLPDQAEGTEIDLAVAVDVAAPDRMGTAIKLFEEAPRTLQIDHHDTNPMFADVNIVRSPLSATGVLIGELIDAMGMSFDKQIAACLYTAVSTDTGSFKQANTDPDAFRLAARCLEQGIDHAEMARKLFDIHSYAKLQLIGRAIGSMTFVCGGRVAVMVLSGDDYRACQAGNEENEGIINYAVNTEQVAMACLISEINGKIRCSFRAQAPYNVARVASAFGGGGHQLAAGCTMKIPLQDAVRSIKDALEEEYRCRD